MCENNLYNFIFHVFNTNIIGYIVTVLLDVYVP